MRVLLVEPAYRKSSKSKRQRVETDDANLGWDARKKSDDETLWYPPLALMKLSRFHKDRGDEVHFVSGCDNAVFSSGDLFSPAELWDRVYVSTLFTFNFDVVVKTINFYKDAVGGAVHKIFVGGIMASLMPKDIFEETGVYPVVGILNSPKQIGLDGDENIDTLAPDYALLNERVYATSDTYYGYASRGCTLKCKWCGVPTIEPKFDPYIDIKSMITTLREEYGDKSKLKLMDNNIAASSQLERVVSDLVELGYGRSDYTNTTPRKKRTVDFNQGLDATYINEKTMELLSRIHISPMRIAFDRYGDRKAYVRAIETAFRFGVKKFSNYMLYNWKDTPRDLYERLLINIEFNETWGRGTNGSGAGEIYSYPMRFAPINESLGRHTNRSRDLIHNVPQDGYDRMQDAVWTKRFIRNVEVMRGAANGAISPTPSLARRTIGRSYEEFIINLYTPEMLIRNRNRFERTVHPHEPNRKPGTGELEEFRAFMKKLLDNQCETFEQFHNAVARNTAMAIRRYDSECDNGEVKKWLGYYLMK